jgi:hypothetical protein
LGADLSLSQEIKAKERDIIDLFRSYGTLLLGTAVTWFILDIAIYDTGL